MPAFLALAGLLALVGTPTSGPGPSTLVGGAFSDADLLALVVGPAVVVSLVGPDTDVGALRELHLAGVRLHARALRLLSAALRTVIACLGTFVATRLALESLHPSSNDVHLSWAYTGRLAGVAIATAALVPLWSFALLYGRTSRQGYLLALVVVGVHVGGLYAGDSGSAQVIKAADPTLALRLLSAGDEGGTKAVGALAAASVALASAAALYYVTAVLGPYSEAARSTSFTRRAPAWLSMVALVVLPALVGGLLPTLVLQGLPWNLRPSLLVEQAVHTAPDDVVKSYLNAVWLGELTSARQFVADPGDGSGIVAGLTQQMRSRPTNEAISTTGVRQGTSATVSAELDSVQLTVCLRWISSSWRVARMDPMGLCAS